MLVYFFLLAIIQGISVEVCKFSQFDTPMRHRKFEKSVIQPEKDYNLLTLVAKEVNSKTNKSN